MRFKWYFSLIFFTSFISGLLDLSGTAYGLEKKNSFIVSLTDKNVRVNTPEVFFSKINIIIENKTANKIIGKVEVENKDFTRFIAIPAEDFRSLTLDIEKTDRISFVPLSPGGQEILLKFGEKEYEIPEAKVIQKD